jgi:hypothetical protein
VPLIAAAGKGRKMTETKHFGRAELESLGHKLDAFAKELSEDERHLLAAVIEAAGGKGTGASLSDRLHHVRGKLDVGASHVIM